VLAVTAAMAEMVALAVKVDKAAQVLVETVVT
jgi:hypothetical protein